MRRLALEGDVGRPPQMGPEDLCPPQLRRPAVSSMEESSFLAPAAGPAEPALSRRGHLFDLSLMLRLAGLLLMQLCHSLALPWGVLLQWDPAT